MSQPVSLVPPPLRAPVAVGVSLLCLALVGLGDYATGRELGFSAFYFVPVLIAVWFSGRAAGVAVAVLSAGVWLGNELVEVGWGSHLAIPVTNATVHLLSFLTVVAIAARLRRVLEHERELLQTKNRFLGMAAHDLRNPLTSVMGYVQLLRRGALGALSDKQRATLDRVAAVSAGLAALLDDLLDVAVIESGRLELQRQDLPLRPLVEERLAIHEVAAEAKAIRLVLEPGPSPTARFDARRLGQVIDNFVSNAVKYSPAATEVRVAIEEEAGWATVRVRDQGPGISAEDQGRLFVEFQRLSAKPTAGESSTGLGLAICHRIVGAHGGACGVRSALGQGSEFFFRVPCPPPASNPPP